MEEYIKLLDLPDEFDLADLKKAYRKKVLQYHPDKASNEAERVGYEALMKKLNEANDYLKDYLEHHDGKYSKASECTNSYTTEENTQEEYYQEENEQYGEEENSNSYSEPFSPDNNNSNYTNRFVNFIKLMFNPKAVFNAFKDLYCKNPKYTVAAVIIALLSVPVWNKLLDSTYSNDNQAYTQESKQEPKQEEKQEPKQENNAQTPSNDTIQSNNKNQQSFQNAPEDLFQNVEKLEWSKYLRDLERRIKLNWMPPDSKNYLKTITEFKIAKDGHLIDRPIIKESSGSDDFDSSCIQAIELTAPFRPLPSDFNGDSTSIEFTFDIPKPAD